MLRKLLDQAEPLFLEGGRLQRLYPFFEAADTFLYTPKDRTKSGAHVRDGIDLKRVMWMVVISLSAPLLMALYNTGYQAHAAIAAGALPLQTWQTDAMALLGLAMVPDDFLACVVHGALYFFPVLAVTFAVGGTWEALFASVRGHEINEGLLVTGFLVPMVLPPAIPLWQVALGVSFGVVLGKEVFGGTGRNIFNPALMTRAFLFFAYPAQISGDVWVAARNAADAGPDAITGATALASVATAGMAGLEGVTWMQAFLGFVPGSMGETSALACLLGAALLLVTGIGSWRIMAGVVIGTIAMSTVFNAVGSTTNPAFAMPFWWHMVLGGWAFGAVYMATDPVSGAQTDSGRWIYGISIGALAIMVRVANPAYPEGMMLAILFMNAFAPAIDHAVIQANVRRRQRRVTA